jgi:AcrR family transcriptional regulator
VSRSAESTRRERTRDALREAALRRFVADGYEATSIADIAAEVGVTTRTFYRYFASKDEVLFADYEARLDWFRRALSVRPRREPIATSVLNAIDSFPDDPEVVSAIARMRAGELDHRRTEAHIQRVQAELGREIEAHLLERDVDGDGAAGDGPFLAAVAANAIAAAVFTALDRWMTGPDHDLDELSRLTALALESLDAGLRSPPS